VEAHIRYPVYLQNAAESDERASRELLRAINGFKQEPAAPWSRSRSVTPIPGGLRDDAILARSAAH
jgi:hypothetical protein